MTPPAILLGGAGTALSVARGLSHARIDVYALGPSGDPLRYSRHRRQFVDLGSDGQLQERMLEWLDHGPGMGVILPCSDDGLEIVARHRADLERRGYVAVEANDEVVLAMLDKQRTFDLAQAAEVPAPWVGAVRTAEEAARAVSKVGFPCALKPRDSHLFARHFPRDKAFILDDRPALEAALETTVALGLRMVISEIVPGPDAGFCSFYTYLDEDGMPLFRFTKRKPRQHPPHFGAGCFHILEPVPEADRLGLQFLQAAGARGLANVEFKHDSRDGGLKLIECNHRFTASNELMRRCGMNLALFSYKRALGLPDLPEIEARRRGVGLWYPIADLRAFLAYRREGELTTSAWIRSLMRPQTFPLASLEDPLPSPATGSRRLFKRMLGWTSKSRSPSPAKLGSSR